MRKGDVYRFSLKSLPFNENFTFGERYVVVLQNVKEGQTQVFVAPLSSANRDSKAVYICEVVIHRKSYVHLEHIVPVHRHKLVDKVLTLKDSEIEVLDQKLLQVLSIDRYDIRDIKGIKTRLTMKDDNIIGYIRYKGRENLKFKITIDKYTQLFGEIQTMKGVLMNLNTVDGLKLCVENMVGGTKNE